MVSPVHHVVGAREHEPPHAAGALGRLDRVDRALHVVREHIALHRRRRVPLGGEVHDVRAALKHAGAGARVCQVADPVDSRRVRLERGRRDAWRALRLGHGPVHAHDGVALRLEERTQQAAHDAPHARHADDAAAEAMAESAA